MTTQYTRDGVAYRSYVSETGGFDAIERVLMISDAYRDAGICTVFVTLRSADGLSLERLASDNPKPPSGAVVLTADSDGADQEAWDVLHAYALRNGVKRIVSVLVCPRGKGLGRGSSRSSRHADASPGTPRRGVR